MNSPSSSPVITTSSMSRSVAPPLSLRVTEIFYSIQGESTHVGRPCVFVRLTGCPLRCRWCDTAYAFNGGTEMTIMQVLGQIRAFGCRLVEVTGGEPLHQPVAFELITTLCNDQYEVLIETSGATDISSVDERAQVILDIKCPGSDMMDRMHWPNVERLKPTDQAKFVLKDRRDYEWAIGIVSQYQLSKRCAVLFSPVFGELPLQTLAEWILHDRLAVRLQMQLHKVIWDPESRGV